MSKHFLLNKCEEKSSLFVKDYSMFIVSDRESVDCSQSPILSKIVEIERFQLALPAAILDEFNYSRDG